MTKYIDGIKRNLKQNQIKDNSMTQIKQKFGEAGRDERLAEEQAARDAETARFGSRLEQEKYTLLRNEQMIKNLEKARVYMGNTNDTQADRDFIFTVMKSLKTAGIYKINAAQENRLILIAERLIGTAKELDNEEDPDFRDDELRDDLITAAELLLDATEEQVISEEDEYAMLEAAEGSAESEINKRKAEDNAERRGRSAAVDRAVAREKLAKVGDAVYDSRYNKDGTKKTGTGRVTKPEPKWKSARDVMAWKKD